MKIEALKTETENRRTDVEETASVQEYGLKTIIGYEKEKREIAELREMLLHAARYKELGIRIPRGLILYGEPGVGKTVLAKALAADEISLIELRAVTCSKADAEERLIDVFKTAKLKTPCVLLLDELDKIAGVPRFGARSEANEKINKVLLQELDKLDGNSDILVVATCNDLNNLGDALTRPGRFDRQLCIELPDERTRILILKEYFSHLKLKVSVDLEKLAKITYGYTGARLESLVNEVAILATTDASEEITPEKVRLIMNKFAFKGLEKAPISNKDKLHRIAVHEAGHAVAALCLNDKSLHGASVLPQGNSLGHVSIVNGENEDKDFKALQNELTVILSGRVAERLVYHQPSLGSGVDLKKAINLLRVLTVTEGVFGYRYTISELFKGPMGMDTLPEKLSCRLSRKVESELKKIDKRAEKLIKKHFALFNEIVKGLTEKQTLSREDLIALKASVEKTVA